MSGLYLFNAILVFLKICIWRNNLLFVDTPKESKRTFSEVLYGL